MTEPHSSISLIGMPGAGKTTIGRYLASITGRRWVDTDNILRAQTGQSLSGILKDGFDAFLGAERKAVKSVHLHDAVISTGGSVVYSDEVMTHLRSFSHVVFLDVPIADLSRRAGDLSARGVLGGDVATLADLYQTRLPLYRQWADITVQAARAPTATAAEILRRLDIPALP